jgi:hypothetical protein
MAQKCRFPQQMPWRAGDVLREPAAVRKRKKNRHTPLFLTDTRCSFLTRHMKSSDHLPRQARDKTKPTQTMMVKESTEARKTPPR